MGNIGHDIKDKRLELLQRNWVQMSTQSKGGAGQKRGEGEKSRDIRLAEALRANLLKRKAQARARSSSKRCDEGGQDQS